MFGQQDEQQQTNGVPAPDGALGDQPGGARTDTATSAPAVTNTSDAGTSDYIMTDPPAQPAAADDGLSSDAATATAGSTVTPTMPAAAAQSSNDDLLNIKQQALQQLTPLVGHLDQSPEERFRTSMMMIQASDNDALIKDAYEAAQNIADDKTRAQALLDIVNEINYFTQNQNSQNE